MSVNASTAVGVIALAVNLHPVRRRGDDFERFCYEIVFCFFDDERINLVAHGSADDKRHYAALVARDTCTLGRQRGYIQYRGGVFIHRFLPFWQI